MSSFLDENNIKKTRAWGSIIGSGLTLGVISGSITVFYVQPNVAKYYFFGLASGLIGGIIVAVILNKRGVIKDGFDPLNRSEDLDNFQAGFKNPSQDKSIIDLIPSLTNDEFIKLVCFRYPSLHYQTKNFVKKELARRQIDNNRFRKQYNTLETFVKKTNGYCPKCGFESYNENILNGEVNCELCGYMDIVDNPDMFVNKLKKVFGFYDYIGLSEYEIDNDLYK
jgi:hypothetical protein